MLKKKVVIGNWKMNKLPNEAIIYVNELETLVKKTTNDVILCVPYIDLFYASMHAQDTNIKIGAQNLHWEKNGRYTGEISGEMLKSIGVEYVIIGHSERRRYFAETDEIVNKKIKIALENKLKPIVCVGENLEQREAGTTKVILENQIEKAFKDLTYEDVERSIVAYEPIWAIGTGKNATPEDANEGAKYIREKITKMYSKDTAERVIIQYGGSLKANNAKEIFKMPEINGGLVGDASLSVEEFANIVNYNN